MKTLTLGKSTLTCTRLAYGCARIAAHTPEKPLTPQRIEQALAALREAYEAGYTLFDTADIYGRTQAETLLGQTLRNIPDMRAGLVIASKCGVRMAGEGAPYRYDLSAEHIVRSCEESLKRLGIDALDLYLLHRPDFLMHPQEVAQAFEQLQAQGKVLFFGVSNFAPATLAMLQCFCPMRLAVNQVRIGLAHLESLYDGTLDQCLAESMTPMAWSPLAGGMLGSGAQIPANHPEKPALLRLHAALDALAQARGADRTSIALAFLLRHPAGIVPIVGATRPEHIRAAIRADEIELSREEWYTLMEAAHGKRLA